MGRVVQSAANIVDSLPAAYDKTGAATALTSTAVEWCLPDGSSYATSGSVTFTDVSGGSVPVYVNGGYRLTATAPTAAGDYVLCAKGTDATGRVTYLRTEIITVTVTGTASVNVTQWSGAPVGVDSNDNPLVVALDPFTNAAAGTAAIAAAGLPATVATAVWQDLTDAFTSATGVGWAIAQMLTQTGLVVVGNGTVKLANGTVVAVAGTYFSLGSLLNGYPCFSQYGGSVLLYVRGDNGRPSFAQPSNQAASSFSLNSFPNTWDAIVGNPTPQTWSANGTAAGTISSILPAPVTALDPSGSPAGTAALANAPSGGAPTAAQNASAVWTNTTRTLTGSGGAIGPTAGANLGPIAFGPVVPGQTLDLSACVSINGQYVTAEETSAIVYTIVDCDSGLPVPGHVGVALVPATPYVGTPGTCCLSDTILTDAEASNYNFRFRPSLASKSPFPECGRYAVAVTFTVGGQYFANFRGEARW